MAGAGVFGAYVMCGGARILFSRYQKVQALETPKQRTFLTLVHPKGSRCMYILGVEEVRHGQKSA